MARRSKRFTVVSVRHDQIEALNQLMEPRLSFAAKLDTLIESFPVKKKTKRLKSPPIKPAKEPQEELTLSVEAGRYFKEQYKLKFLHDYPEWGPKQNSLMKNWTKGLTREQVLWAIKTYFSWVNPFAIKTGHSLETLTTRFVEMVSDYKRPAQKQTMFKEYELTKSEVLHSEFLRRTNEESNGYLPRGQSERGALQNKAQSRFYIESCEPLENGEEPLEDSDHSTYE